MSKKHKILLIEDEEDFSFFIKKNLERTKAFEVETTTNGRKGINMARMHQPDLILLDVVMPEVSGADVAEALLADPKTKKIPIIFLTAVMSEMEMGDEPIKTVGGRNFIAKTIGTVVLIDTLNRFLEDGILI